MSEFKGTPGPWVVDEESFMVTDSCGGFVAEFDNGRWDEDHSNADLISAAPELLEALQDALHAHDKHGEHSEWDFARAAIAKALGQ